MSRANWIPDIALRVIGSINVRKKRLSPGVFKFTARDSVKLVVFVLICPAGMFFADVFIPYENGHAVGAEVMIDMDYAFDPCIMHGIDRYECA